MRNKKRDTFYIGLALFASYFGAGNLIFPPFLGLVSGNQWIKGSVGLMVSAVLMPIVALYVISKAGSVEKLTKNLHPNFSKYLLLVIMLFAGNISVPRTGAVAFELGLRAIFPNFPISVFAILYFGTALYFALDLSAMVDKVARYLTPALVIILIGIILKGIFFPVNLSLSEPKVENVLVNSFLGGYQTGDLLVSFLIGTVFIGDVVRRGYKTDEERNSMIRNAGIITFVLFLIIYVGLLYLGANVSGIFDENIDRSVLLLNIVESLLGKNGLIFLSIAVVLACLTTAIGQITSIANFFSEFSKGRLSHKNAAIIFSIIGAGITLLGVEKIVFLTTPIFLMVYPSVILLMIFGIFYKKLENKKTALRAAMAFTLLVSFTEALASISNIHFLKTIIDAIFLSKSGFAWVLPATFGFMIGSIYEKFENNLNFKKF